MRCPRIELQGKSPTFGILSRVELKRDKVKFEKTRIHFSRQVFAALAVVVANAPNIDQPQHRDH